MNTVECGECEGDKGYYYSCCGDDLGPDPDSDFCPTCGEHCGEGDFEPCESCNGLGKVNETQSEKQFLQAVERMKILVKKHSDDVELLKLRGMYVRNRMPRKEPHIREYFNTTDQRIWRLANGSWTPDPLPGNHISLIRNTYKMNSDEQVEEMVSTDNVWDLYPDKQKEVLFDVKIEHMTEKEILEKYYREGETIWRQSNKPQNEQKTTNYTDEPLQDYSIFKS